MSISSGRVYVSDIPWLELGVPCIRRNGEEVCDALGREVSAWSRPHFSESGGGNGESVDGETFGRSGRESSNKRGRDGLGRYEEISRRFLEWEMAARRYIDDGDNGSGDGGDDEDDGFEDGEYFGPSGTLIFEQRFVGMMNGTAYPAPTVQESARNGLASRFPVIVPAAAGPSPLVLGAIRFSGPFVGYSGVDRWSADDVLDPLGDALDSGPVVLFTTECALVISSASSFMSSGMSYEPERNEMSFGVLGSVDSIPPGHSTSVIFSSYPLVDDDGEDEPDGIRRATRSWGRKLMALHETKRRKYDVTLRYLQFSTDHGAYYYYRTERGMNYQETIQHVKKVSDEKNIPFGQWLMDSWWYYKGVAGGVKNWTAMPSVFPNGIAHVRDVTGWDIVAHNRYFSSDTDYARQNGGLYEFVIEGTMSMPLERRFWDDLFVEAKRWGLSTYEQDWLYYTFAHFNHTLRSVSAGQEWLVQMSDAAAHVGIPIQYCMAWPRHVLQSVECDAVTQVRASEDYAPGSDVNWRALGLSSMLVDALDLTPLKDSFRTYPGKQQRRERDRPSHIGGTDADSADEDDDGVESSPRLHGAVSSLSRGTVSPSDRIDLMDADLVLRSCDAGGKLLRPDVPASRTDGSLFEEAGLSISMSRPRGNVIPGSDGREGKMAATVAEGQHAGANRAARQQASEVWSTYSSLSGIHFTYILAAGTTGAFEIGAKDAYRSENPYVLGKVADDRYVAWDVDRLFVPISLPFRLPPTNSTDFRLFCIAPVFESRWAFFGEAETKWIAVSADRFSSLLLAEDGFSVVVEGNPGEDVRVMVRSPDGTFHRLTCTIPNGGRTVLSSKMMGCGSSELVSEEFGTEYG